MSLPVIGITCDYVDDKPHYMLPWTYAEAIEKAGGLPFMLPYKVNHALVPHYIDQLDGLLLSGGNDLDPATFGESRHLMAKAVDPDREHFEMALLAEAERRTLPIMGICLGLQVMNVSRGGSLHQFLPDLDRDDPLEHRRMEDWRRRHDVSVEPDSHIEKATGKRLLACNTSHKQSVKKLGERLRITARAPDGVIEGIEDPALPFYAAVQWHPERQNDEADHLALFKRFIEHAKK